MGRKEREALKQMAEVAREGFELKKALMEEASKRKEEKQVRSLGQEQMKFVGGETVSVAVFLCTCTFEASEEARIWQLFKWAGDWGLGHL